MGSVSLPVVASTLVEWSRGCGMWQRSPYNILAIPLGLLLDRAYSPYTQSLISGEGTCVRVWCSTKESPKCIVGVDREQGVVGKEKSGRSTKIPDNSLDLGVERNVDLLWTDRSG